MNALSTRVAVLFAVVAVVPVLLTALVWLGVYRWGTPSQRVEEELARRHVETLNAQRKAAVDALCHDDLAVDQLLADRSAEAPPSLDYDRLFAAETRAAGLDALWVLDSTSGELIASGHADRTIGRDGAALLEQSAGSGPARVVSFGDHPHQTFVADSCTIVRESAGVTILGAHRLTELAAFDPDHVHVVAERRPDDVVLIGSEPTNGEAAPGWKLVWRSRIDDRAPPLALWLAGALIVAVGLALLFGGYLHRWLQSSVDELTEAATRIGAGDFATTVREGENGAFKATATAFNRMTRDLRNAREQLRQTERIAAWQDIARRLAHELKNPLSPIRLSIETMRKAHARSHTDFDALFEESTKTILAEVERLRHIIDEFSRFARLPSPTPEREDLREVVPQAVSLYASESVAVSAELPGHPVWAEVDAEQITQVLHNLLQNACDSTRRAHPEGGGSVHVTLEQGIDEARIRVEDDGVGIEPDRLDEIFEPYFTDKEQGTGLGLAIARRIVTEHGGRIDVQSRPGRTAFTIIVPGHAPS